MNTTVLLFTLNLVVDYFLLLLTAKLFHHRPGFLRLAGGAILGALAALLFIPAAGPVLWAAIPLTAAVMVRATFRRHSWQELALLWGGLFVVAFMTAGAILALFSIAYRTTPGPPAGLLLLFAVCVLFYLLFGVLRPYLEERKWQIAWHVDLCVSWRGNNTVISAYTYTGNRLRDPYSQAPVIITYYRSLEGLLPEAVLRRFSEPVPDPWASLTELDDYTLARCFSLVPFTGVGTTNGMLIGFKPDSIVATRGKRSWSLDSRVLLGLTRRDFGPVASYQALLPPELVKAG